MSTSREAPSHGGLTREREREPDDAGVATSEQHLVERAHRGSHSAIDALFERYRPWLRRWSRGRLPRRARGAVDTSDLVQETLQRTFTHLTSFNSTQARALRVYLRRAVDNRIRDEMRRATFRQGVILPEGSVRDSHAAAQHRQLVDDETWRRYLDAVKRLPDRDRRLVVARTELGYNGAQLAFLERLSSPAVARVTLRRAMLRLSGLMSDE